MSSPEPNSETGLDPVAPRTLENGFAKDWDGVIEWNSAGLRLDALPDPVKEGSADEAVIEAWSSAMAAHQQLGGGILDGTGGVTSYSGAVDIGSGDSPSQLLVRMRQGKEGADQPACTFHAIDVSADGFIDVRRVAEPASFQIDEGGDVNDQPPPKPNSFETFAQKDAVQAFRKLHLLRRRQDATIELIAVNGAPHLVIDERRRTPDGAAESCYAWSMVHLRAIQEMEDVRSDQIREIMMQELNMTTLLKVENAPASDLPAQHPLQHNAPGTARRRVLNRAEAYTLRAHLDLSGQAPAIEADRERAGDLFRAALQAAGGDKLASRNGAYVLDSAEATQRLIHLASDRPDVLVAVRERHEKDEGVIWDIRPYVIERSGDITRIAAYSSSPQEYGGDCGENTEGLRKLCEEAATRAGQTMPPSSVPTMRQEQAAKALRSLLDVAERQRISMQTRTDMQPHDPRIMAPLGRPFLVLDTLIRPCLLEMAHVKGSVNGVVRMGTEVKSHVLEADGGAAEVHENEGSEYISHAQYPFSKPADIAQRAVKIGVDAASLHKCTALLRDMGHAEKVLDADAEGPAP